MRSGVIYDNPNLPLRKYYGEFIQKLQEGGQEKDKEIRHFNEFERKSTVDLFKGKPVDRECRA